METRNDWLKKIMWLLVVVFCLPLVLTAAPTQAAKPQVPQISAPAAIVIDTASGHIFYGKNIHRRAPMASTTKIMTALTAVSIEGTSLTEKYTVVKADVVGEASMGLRMGETLTFQDLLYGMLLNSGNDAATAIARYAGAKLPGTGDPFTRFMAQMNANAVNLGLKDTHYANPHGLDQAGHYSSAFDLAITGWYLLKNPTLSKIVATQSTVAAGHSLSNLNVFLRRYSGANGIKPGFTDAAALCLVASATRNGSTVIAVVMGEDNAGYQADPTRLMDYSFGMLEQPDIQQKLQQGATSASSTDYIGRPSGNRLIIAGAASTVGFDPNNPMINAQITQDQGNPTPTPTDVKSTGGFNFFGLILLVLIAAGIFYCLLRFTPVGGERGREIAFQMEDYATNAFGMAKNIFQKVWGFVRPGPIEEEPFSRSRTLPTRPADRNQRLSTLTSARSQRQEPELDDDSQDDAPEVIKVESYGTTRPYKPTAFDDIVSQKANQTEPKKSPIKAGDTLDNFFDDVNPFLEDDKSKPKTETVASPQLKNTPTPPRPLSSREYAPPKTEVKPVEPTPRATPTPPRPAPTVTPPPIATSSPMSGSGFSSTSRASNASPTSNRSSAASGDVSAMARQAIDYAHAGRVLASTDEFRRVVEQEPMFDFGTIDEFDQMPVAGFKALANAYRDVNRLKFAMLLLDMGIERYPNDLELRNMQRSLRREA